jgi:hypothetical protein
MLHPVRLRNLDVTVGPGSPAFVSAAGGLVRIGRHFHVIADDCHFLARFPVSGAAPGVRVRLIDGDLPTEAKARKRAKPDFESLLRVPPTVQHPRGSLLVLGSGSHPNRMRGLWLALGVDGSLGAPEPLDLSPLFCACARHLSEINVEGAVAMDGRLILFNRANTANALNAMIEFPLADAIAALAQGGNLEEPRIRRIDLGLASGVPFGFTDATRLRGDIVFSAVAEDTSNAYGDGACAGSALGMLSAGGRIKRLWPIAGSPKIEGITARTSRGGLEIHFVTDADDPDVAAALWRCQVPETVG